MAAMQAVLGDAPSNGRRRRKAANRAVTAPTRRRRRKLSAQGRANIIAAQKALWAKLKAEKASTAADHAPAAKARRPRKRNSAAKK